MEGRFFAQAAPELLPIPSWVQHPACMLQCLVVTSQPFQIGYVGSSLPSDMHMLV
jgi:hypothetical protein